MQGLPLFYAMAIQKQNRKQYPFSTRFVLLEKLINRTVKQQRNKGLKHTCFV